MKTTTQNRTAAGAAVKQAGTETTGTEGTKEPCQVVELVSEKRMLLMSDKMRVSANHVLTYRPVKTEIHIYLTNGQRVLLAYTNEKDQSAKLKQLDEFFGVLT